MKKASTVITAVTAVLLSGVAAISIATAHEDQPGAAEEQDVIGENEVYGGNLMTLDERRELHMKYCSAKNATERHALFTEHGRLIHERAKEKGVEMPKSDMSTQKTWIRHTCPNMDVMHGKTDDAGHHGTRHDMKDVAPKTDGTGQTQ